MDVDVEMLETDWKKDRVLDVGVLSRGLVGGREGGRDCDCDCKGWELAGWDDERSFDLLRLL
jgi:hypothetical protein